MSSEKFPMTRKGYESLQNELHQLKSVERPNVIQAIADAREHGDLSENAEYHAAREKQGFIEGRIADIETKISRAEAIDPAKIKSSSVKFGATVTLLDEDTDEEKTFQIVGVDEADVENGLLSFSSPLARALMTKETRDVIEVTTPKGFKSYEILEILFQ